MSELKKLLKSYIILGILAGSLLFIELGIVQAEELFSDTFLEHDGQASNWISVSGKFILGNNSYSTLTTETTLSIPSNKTFMNWRPYIFNVSFRRHGNIDSYGYTILYTHVKEVADGHESLFLLLRQTGKAELYIKNDKKFIVQLARCNIPKDSNYHEASIYVSGTKYRFYFDGSLCFSTNIPAGFENGTIGVGTNAWNSTFKNISINLWKHEPFVTDFRISKKYFYDTQDISINFKTDAYDISNFNLKVITPRGVSYAKSITSSGVDNHTFVYPVDFEGYSLNEYGIYTVIIETTDGTVEKANFEYKPKPILTFVSASDIHYKNDDYTNDTLKKFVDGINNEIWFPLPDFIAIVGDSTDTSDFLSELKIHLDKLETSYYIVPAGHEALGESVGERGHKFFNTFGKRYNYIINEKGYYFIFGGTELDYAPLTSGLGNSFGEPKYNIWLNNMLANTKGAPTIVFSHIIPVSPRFSGGAMNFNESPILSDRTRRSLEKYNVLALFSGHSHITGKAIINNISYVTNGAVFNLPSEYRYIEIYSDRIYVHTIKYKLDTDMNLAEYWYPSTDTLHNIENYSYGTQNERDFIIALNQTSNGVIKSPIINIFVVYVTLLGILASLVIYILRKREMKNFFK